MSYIVFARKWRPKDFDEVVGQLHITSTLKSAIQKNKVAHAYIFTGPRGIGKTSTARILAEALNCEHSKGPTVKPCNKCDNCISIFEGRNIDVIEIDGASNRGIDEVRQLRESVKFAPAKSRFKIYIIDEVHMLTPEAFNALLKTLEEPPPYVKFIFATTDPDRVLPTILSRCQRFDFRRIPTVDIIKKLKEVSSSEKIKADEEALFYIAKASDGSLRDAESILDQLSCVAEKIDAAAVNGVLGLIEEDFIFSFADFLLKKDARSALELIDDVIGQGKDIQLFLHSLIEHFRNLLVFKVADKYFQKLVDLPENLQEKIAKQAKGADYEYLSLCFKELLATKEAIKYSEAKRIILEVAVIRLAEPEAKISVSKPSSGTTKFTDTVGKMSPHPEKRKSVEIKDIDVSLKQEKSEAQEQVLPEVSSGAKAVSVEEVKNAWGSAIEEIKSQRMSIGTYLSEGNLLAVEDNVINVGFLREHNFHKEFLEKKDNRQVLEETFSRLLNTSVKVLIKIADIPKDELPNQNSGAKENPDAGKKGGVENFIQSALDTFKGRFV